MRTARSYLLLHTQNAVCHWLARDVHVIVTVVALGPKRVFIDVAVLGGAFQLLVKSTYQFVTGGYGF